MKIDRLDIGILNALQKDATLSTADIASQVGLSQSPCWRRINLLEQAGIIKGRVALLSREFGRALNLPDVKEKIASMSLEPQGMTPAQLSATLQRDAAKWKRIVAEAGIKLD